MSDWSSDVCSSDLRNRRRRRTSGSTLRWLESPIPSTVCPELVEGLSFTSAAKGITVLRQAQHERKKGMALIVLADMLAPAAAPDQAFSVSPTERTPVPRAWTTLIQGTRGSVSIDTGHSRHNKK